MTVKAWTAMTPRERDAKVAEALWPEGRPVVHPQRISTMLASTWPGFGLVVEKMRELGWVGHWYESLTKRHNAWFTHKTGQKSPRAITDSAPSATALAAVLAMEGEVK